MNKRSETSPTLTTISCPQCGRDIELSEALSAKMSADMAAAVKDKIQAAAQRAKEAALAESAHVQKELSGQLATVRAKLNEAQQKEISLLRRERALEGAQNEFDLKLERALAQERDNVRQAEETRLRTEFKREALKSGAELRALRARVEEAETAESALRQRQIEVEERERKLALEMERRLDADRTVIARKLAQEHHDREQLVQEKHELELGRLRQQITNLQQAATAPTSSETTGEALEIMICRSLKAAFPLDKFEDVPRGQSGADIVQIVCNATQTICGKIVWECKQTKTWSTAWLSKAKTAQQAANADAAVVVTFAMPKDIEGNFGHRDGVWIANVAAAVGLGVALRHAILRVSAVTALVETRDARLAALHDHLLSNEFRLNCEAVVSAVQALNQQFDAEERALQRSWERRRKHLGILQAMVARIFGGFEGILLAEIPAGKALALPEEDSLCHAGHTSTEADLYEQSDIAHGCVKKLT